MSVTILKCAEPLRLAKLWRADGTIGAAADVAWFKAHEQSIRNINDIHETISQVEDDPRIAIVKEAISPDANQERLRRTCSDGADPRTGECYSAGLRVVERNWVVVDIDGLPRPNHIDRCDGEAQATYARSLLPDAFQFAACVWQLSGSSGHPTKVDEIRSHLFFMCDNPVVPTAWKPYLGKVEHVDVSIYDKAKLIFTASPIIADGMDPIGIRHGILDGDEAIRVPARVLENSQRILSGVEITKVRYAVSKPMHAAAERFVDIISESNILRSKHPAYTSERSRRLAFCSILSRLFGISDEEALASSFYRACVGPNDHNSGHDVTEALKWATLPAPDRAYTAWKLLRDAAAALFIDGKFQLAKIASKFAHTLRSFELGDRT